MTTMARSTRKNRTQEYANRFFCGVCELSEFTEGFKTAEERQAHWDETGHCAVQEWLDKHGRQADRILAEEKINRAFPGSTVVTDSDEHHRPGSKISGRSYGSGDEIVTKAQLRYAEQLGIKVNGMSKKAASKAIDAAKKSAVQVSAQTQAPVDFVAATDKQLAYAKRLINERGADREEVVLIRQELNAAHNSGGVSKSLASSAIDRLLKINPASATTVGEAPVASSEPRNGPIRITNRYPGKCDQCGETVEPGEGVWELADDGQRTVSHKTGECPMVLGVPNGRYAVEHEGTLKFYVVKPSGLYVMASDEEHKIKAKSYIDAVVELINIDPLAAMKRYGASIGKCGRCGRTLTDTESREIGIGPICLAKMEG